MSGGSVSYNKLFRSRTERKIAGICGGLAIHFRVDPVLMRLIFVLFFLAGGCALVIYIILWFLIPLEPVSTELQKTDKID